MIDVCFSTSTGGTLNTIFKQCKKGDFISEALKDKNMDADVIKSLIAPSDELKCIWLYLDLFKIGDADFEDGRMELLSHFYERPCNAKRTYHKLLKDVDDIVDEAKKGNTIRIWYSELGYALCGLYYLACRLETTQASVILVPLPKNIRLFYCNEIYPRDIPAYMSAAHFAGKKELAAYAAEWKRLCKENADMRVVQNKKVVSADLDYFDDLICECTADGPLCYEKLIGRSLGKIFDEGNFVFDGFVGDRIDLMIENGTLEITGNDDGEHLSDYLTDIVQRK